MEEEAREMSRLAAKAADMSSRAAGAAQRSRRAAVAAQRSRRTGDVADWSSHIAEVAEMSRRAAAAWENFSPAGEDSYRRMHAIVHSQIDQISGWARMQDEATGVIRQLGEGNTKLRGERNLLRAKIAGRAKQEEEETAAVLQRTGVIIEKLMGENVVLRMKHRRLVEESVDALNQHIEDRKELIAARYGN